jgi:hypothetical protein
MTQENSEATNNGYSSEELSGFRETLSKVEEGSLPKTALDELPMDIIDQVSAGEGQIFEGMDSDLAPASNPQESELSETAPEPEDLNLKYKRKADEANTWKQKFDSLERKYESSQDFELKLKDPEFRKKYFEEQGYVSNEELEDIDLTMPLDEDGDEDFLNPEYQKKLNKVLVQYTKDRKSQAERSQAEMQQSLRQKEIDRTFSEISDLQEKYPALRTEKSFKELDTEFIGFKKSLGSDLQRFMEDSDFRTAKEKEGIVAPSELDTYLTLLNINSSKSKYPSLEAAYRDSSVFDEHLNSMKQPADNSGKFEMLPNASTDQLKEEFDTMGNGQSGDSGLEGDDNADLAFLERWKGREHEMTDTDEKQYDAIIARMAAKYG